MSEFQYPKSPDVYWEKWVDPYQLDHDEFSWHEFDESDIEETDVTFSDLPASEYEKEFETDEQNEVRFLQTPAIKHLFTPFGIIPLTEYSHPAKLFKFWTGHANFSISKELALVMAKIPGVETLNIWTRYRFRIGIGKLFDDKMVMFDLKEAMIKYYKDKYDQTNNQPAITNIREST